MGVALPYAFSQAIFGGNAETAALLFKRAGHEPGYYWLVSGFMTLGLVVALCMRDTQKQSLIADG